MPITWTDIEKALDELIAYEEGIKFQRLSVALAKQEYQGIIATEVKKDGGEDALAHSFLTKDGKRFDVACSITTTLNKISEDAKRIYGRGVVLDLLLYYTPTKVSNTLQDDWKIQIKKEFGCDLLVVSRENIIHELIKPEGHWMCSTFLNITQPINQDLEETFKKITGAASDILEQWKKRYRFAPAHIIDIDLIKLNDTHEDKEEAINSHHICTTLADGGRSIIYGAPGAGKTTLLIQITEELLNPDKQKVPLLISLPEWIDSNKSVLEFIAQHPDFISQGITNDELALLYKKGHLVFVFNGWNEIPISSMQEASRQLRQVDREYLAAGIIVATRKHTITPPLFEPLSVKLSPVSDIQRKKFLVSALADKAYELLHQIESNSSLSIITQTPLILSEIASLFEFEEKVPQTKAGVLRRIINRTEESQEHALSLDSAPLWGRANNYLSKIAFYMTREGRTIFSEDKARKAITQVSTYLKTKGQIETVPEPNSILNTLCAHHLLNKSDYPLTTISFIHQQFQELYSSEELTEKMLSIIKEPDNDKTSDFKKQIINIPVWEESLKLMAEKVLDDEAEVAQADKLELRKTLVAYTIDIDPLFAAELSSICGKETWTAVKSSFDPLLRKWYGLNNEDDKACALAAMTATGSDNFSDIIWPLLEHSDQQVRLRTYDSILSLSCLGVNWKEKVSLWEEDRLLEFINNLYNMNGLDAITASEEFTTNTQSFNVQLAAINSLLWQGAITKYSHVVSRCNDEIFEEIVRKNYLPNTVPNELLSRIIATHKKLILKSEDIYEHLKLLYYMSKYEKTETMELLKEVLINNVIEDATDYKGTILQNVIEAIHSEDPIWLSSLITRKMINGEFWRDYWLSFIHEIPEEIAGELVEKLLDEKYPDKKARVTISLISKATNIKDVKAMFEKLIATHKVLISDRNATEAQREFYWRLKKAIGALSWPIKIDAIIENYTNPQSDMELDVILELLGTIDEFRSDIDVRINIPPMKLESLRVILRDYYKLVLTKDDFHGELKAHLSLALSKFGESQDLKLIIKLIYLDITRRQRGIEARKKGEFDTPIARGAPTSWSDWHLKALMALDPINAEKAILALLKEPIYEQDSKSALVQLLYGKPETIDMGWSIDYDKDSRVSTRAVDENKRSLYVNALLERINVIEQEHEKSKDPGSINPRLKGIAATLAHLNGLDHIPIILDIMSLDGQWDGWTRVETLDVLIKSGVLLETQTVEEILNPTINQLTKEGVHSNQNSFLLTRCICILLFSSDKSRSIERVKELVQRLPAYEMRNIIIVLGQCHYTEAEDYLIELAQAGEKYKHMASELIEALYNSNSKKATTALLTIIDSSIPEPRIKIPLYHGSEETLSNVFTKMYHDNLEIRNIILQLCKTNLSANRRKIIAKVLMKIATTETIAAGLHLISDKATIPIPFDLVRAIENVLFTKQYSGPYWYNLIPKENNYIRSLLFDMSIDDTSRYQGAIKLLSKIYKWRIERGWPMQEPRHPNIDKGISWPILN